VEKFHLTPISSNGKTGPMGVTTSPMQTCPSACPFRGRGCYSNYGPLLIFWKHLSEAPGSTSTEYAALLARVRVKVAKRAMWRHNQAGDLIGECNVIDHLSALDLVKANKGKRGFTYTHFPVIEQTIDQDTGEKCHVNVAGHNRGIIEEMNRNGFAVSVSCNSPAHADRVLASGIEAPVTCILPEQVKKDKTKKMFSPGGNKILICPNVSMGKTCTECGLCARTKRDYIIAFPCHGSGKKRAEEVLAEWVTGDYIAVDHKRKGSYKLRPTHHMGKDQE